MNVMKGPAVVEPEFLMIHAAEKRNVRPSQRQRQASARVMCRM